MITVGLSFPEPSKNDNSGLPISHYEIQTTFYQQLFANVNPLKTKLLILNFSLLTLQLALSPLKIRSRFLDSATYTEPGCSLMSDRKNPIAFSLSFS